MAGVTLGPEDFEIDSNGNVRLKDPEKGKALLECLDNAQPGGDHKERVLPQVKVHI